MNALDALFDELKSAPRIVAAVAGDATWAAHLAAALRLIGNLQRADDELRDSCVAIVERADYSLAQKLFVLQFHLQNVPRQKLAAIGVIVTDTDLPPAATMRLQ
jgi:hypothetical protein